MYGIKENNRTLDDGTIIETFERDVISCNILEAEAGTTGLRGGDTGHGGRTYLRIEDVGGSDITIKPIEAKPLRGNGGVEIILGGDCELETIIKALKFIIKALKYQKKVLS